MTENDKPDSWQNDLSELIKVKKEEKELLMKLRESIDPAGQETGKAPDAEKSKAGVPGSGKTEY